MMTPSSNINSQRLKLGRCSHSAPSKGARTHYMRNIIYVPNKRFVGRSLALSGASPPKHQPPLSPQTNTTGTHALSQAKRPAIIHINIRSRIKSITCKQASTCQRHQPAAPLTSRTQAARASTESPNQRFHFPSAPRSHYRYPRCYTITRRHIPHIPARI